MERDEVLTWTKQGYDDVTAMFGYGQQWWPNGMGQQAQATLWALAIMLRAADSRCAGRSLNASLSAGPGKSEKERLLKRHWAVNSSSTQRAFAFREVMVDFSVQHWDSATPVQFTGESEMHQAHGVGTTMSRADDYSWDFFKLMVVPSPSRLFVARVGGTRGASPGERCKELARSLREIVARYGLAYLRPNDELGGIILPSGSKSWQESVVFWLDRGKLRFEVASPWDEGG